MDQLTGISYLVNANIPSDVQQMQGTSMALDGCASVRRRLQDTAFSLLEISFGDGLADALEQSRRSDYRCAGFTPDGLTSYILVFWVFLTNVLVLNMLIAMMNYTFDNQLKRVHSVWLLDVSYRIMRYERIFPELVVRLQRPVCSYSIWRYKFWTNLLSDCLLALYCVPEVHTWGYGHVGYIWIVRNVLKCIVDDPEANDRFKSLEADIDTVLKKDATITDAGGSGKISRMFKSVNSVRAPRASDRLEKLAKHDVVAEEVIEWEKALQAQFATVQLPGTNADRENPLQESQEQATRDQSSRHQLLVLVSLIYQLNLIQQTFDESRTLAVTRPWRTQVDGKPSSPDHSEDSKGC